MSGDFHWTELERVTRTMPGRAGKTCQRHFVRARCACGTVRLMPSHVFDQRATSRCNRCRIKRAGATGWAHARLLRTRRKVHTQGGAS